MSNNEKIQGDYELQLRFADDRIFLNYYGMDKGNHVQSQVKDGKIMQFVYTSEEVEQAESDGVEIDVFKQQEITLSSFIEKVKSSIEHSKKTV